MYFAVMSYNYNTRDVVSLEVVISFQQTASHGLYGPATEFRECHLQQYSVTWWNQLDI